MICKAQVVLTVEQAKRLIAKAVFRSEQFKQASKNARILLKGSTTVSALSQLASNEALSICGRMSTNGMKANRTASQTQHWLLLENGQPTRVDDGLEEISKSLTPKDLFITGANLIDNFGNAAMLIGSTGGGGYGKVIGSIYTEGVPTLVLATSDKLVFGNISALYPAVSRKGCDYAEGMACGLLPVPGELITECKAIEMLANVQALIFARGGIEGANGASAVQISGEQHQVEQVLVTIDEIKTQSGVLGANISLQECVFPCVSCKTHLACKYAKKHTIHR